MSGEAIAIIGIGCRLPGGVVDAASAFRASREGVDAVGPVPLERWPTQGLTLSGRTVPGMGAFLDRVDQFDAGYFGISPREARAMDPAQRLLLEVSVEALEHGAVSPDAVSGRPVGVYVGMGLSDYGRRHFLSDASDRLDAWSGTGTLSSVASGRIAYTLGLTGPALSVHTACSSSLVAIHLAVQALRAGQVELALAGGVNLLLAPEPTVYFAELQALSPSGKCRTFDAAADGYVRGEGCGMVLLKRLSDARRDGDEILAVIRGTAVNQDGRSNGLTAPSARAQEAVIRAALADGGVDPSEVGMVEAHGTGTPLGDPIELRALAAVYGPGTTPCQVVSAKTRIGHLEAAAGVAGLIQAIGAVRDGWVPPHLHLNELNPRANLSNTRLSVPTTGAAWEGHRLAGISAFGLSGTNAHLVIEAPPERVPRVAQRVAVVAVSGHTANALLARIDQVERALDDGLDPLMVAAAASAGRGVHRYRAVATMGEGAPVWAKGEGRKAPDVVFAFTGQGSQVPGMARGLDQTEPVFHRALDRSEAAWFDLTGESLREAIMAPAEHSRIHDTELTQPALFAVGYALATLWMSWGIRPSAVMGHSVGEITAATVAGIMSVEDGLQMVAARGELLGALPRDGAMLAVQADAAEVNQVIVSLRLPVDVAAINAPDEVVISGERSAVLLAQDRFVARGMRAKELQVSHAFHSSLVEPAMAPFREVVARLRLAAPTIPLYSCLTGRLADASIRTPEFWVDHLRGAVRFADAVKAAVADGLELFVECGPRPILSGAGARTAPQSVWVGALQPDRDDRERMIGALGDLWLRGARPDWSAVHRGVPRAALPPYPFQRERHWIDPLPPRGAPPAGMPLYRLDWVRPPTEAHRPTGRWLVLGNPGGMGGALQSLLTERGAEAHCSPSSTGGAAHVVAFVDKGVPGMLRIVELLADASVHRLWAVVSGESDDADVNVLHGVSAVAAVEFPERWGGLIRLDPGMGDRAPARLADLVTSSLGHEVISVDAMGPRVPQLAPMAAIDVPPPALDPDAIYAVTGGTGRIGLSVAGLLVDLGAQHLLLMSRSGVPDGPRRGEVAALEARGVKVRVASIDLTDASAVRQLFKSQQRAIRGVVHAAGVAEKGPLVGTSPAQLAEPLRAKREGAQALHDALSEQPVDFVLLLSSVAALWGSAGLGGYAAANASMHGLARRWRSQGWPVTAVAMGPWALGGMVSEEELRSFARLGVRPMPADDVLATLSRLMGRHVPPLVVLADVDWRAFLPLANSRRPRHLFDVVGAGLNAESVSSPNQPEEASPEDRADVVVLRVKEELAAVLGRGPTDAIDPDAGFFELGLDSVMAVELAERLRRALGHPVPATVAFDYPNLGALQGFMLRELGLADDLTVDVLSSRLSDDEPIAIVGIGCRFPGAADPEAYWQLLMDGVDAVKPIPADRWDSTSWYDPVPGTPGHTVARTGGFLDDLTTFEPDFFGISPREAAALDPQQRLLLEVTWEALEQAGIAPDSLDGVRAGVFVGIGRSEYWDRLRDPSSDASDSYPWGGTGNESSFAAGRLAHLLGLRGPTMAVNTACSSSLVATHLGVRALRDGEAKLAIIGGVNVLLSPESMVYLSQIRALSPTGRCRTFDAGADGYVRGEGCGVLVLERLSDALARGHRVLAVIRGTAVGHDGHASGLTVPSGTAQQDVLRRALRNAGLDASDVEVLEAHGTGTALGDPIEMGAIRAVYGDREQPLRVGSVKTQIGHLETAAGVAGLIKLVLAIQHGQVPGTLHLGELNPALPLDFPVHIPTRTESWAAGARRAAVSSFGISGTNAHVVLEGPPASADGPEVARRLHLLLLSGHTDEALREGIKGVKRVLKDHGPAAIASTLVRGRAARRHRLSIVGGNDASELRKRLRSAGPSDLVEAGNPPRLAWLFTGQGAQRPGMAAGLYQDDPVFRDALDDALHEVGALAIPLKVDDLRRALLTKDPRIHDTRLTQPALVAYQWALAERWRQLSVVPELVCGHSVGEISAAAVAGLLSLADAMWLAAERGRLMSELPKDGAMVAALAPEDRVRPLVEAEDGVSVAAVNGPMETVFAGVTEGVERIASGLEASGVTVRRLKVSHAFHSPLMGPVLEPLAALSARLTSRQGRITLVSGVDGHIASELTPDHWVRHARGTVWFADAVRTMTGRGIDTFLEIGPRPVLCGMVAAQAEGRFVTSADKDRDDLEVFLEGVGQLWSAGVPLDARSVVPETLPINVPTTAWQRTRHWVDAPHEEMGAQNVRLPIFQRLWEEAPAPDHPPAGRVAVLTAHTGLAEELHQQLIAVDVEAELVPPEASLAGYDHVICFGPVDPDQEWPHGAARSAMAVLQRVVAMPAPRPRVWWVTRGAVAVREQEPVEAEQTAVWGLAAAAMLEHPDVFGGVVDLDPDDDATGLAAALSCGEPMAAMWSGQALVPRIRPWEPEEEPTPPRGSWLVTGGAGALGRQVTRWLLDSGADHVFVVGRKPPSDEAVEFLGAKDWTFIEADVSEAEQVEAVLKTIADQPTPPLKGVVHAAGVRGDGLLRGLDEAGLRAVWRAKVLGAWNLHQLTHGLEHFVLFSSAVSWFGRAGQAAYGSANAWLDGLAQYRHARGMPAISLAWGPWAGAGMAEDVEAEAWDGAAPMSVPTALAALQASFVPHAPSVLAIFPVDWEAFSKRWPGGAPPLLHGLPGVATHSEPGGASPLVRRLKLMSPGERYAALRDAVESAARAVLGRDDPLPERRGFVDAGMDSLMAVQLSRRVGGQLDLSLSPTIAFDHPDTASLTTWLLGKLQLGVREPSVTATGPIERDDPLAVVGMACRFPGANSPEELWQMVLDGRSAIREVPPERWDIDAWFGARGEPGRIYARHGGFLDQVDLFDPEFFGISAREATSLDPQQRLLLEVCYHALERAGRAGATLRGSRTGVFVGIGERGYLRRFQKPGESLYPDAWAGTGNDPSFAAGRVAYALGLRGPTLAVNTTCSSSLVAVHLAAQALSAGECDTALAGGVALQLMPDDTAYLCELGALSPTGACHVFDASADGYVRGEGCGMVVLRRLSDALRDGDRVLAVIRGTAINHDGASSGLTVPNGEAQAEVLRNALRYAGVDPRDVGYLETHGTGTRLGDPVEVGAAMEVYGNRRGRPLFLGSVKANIGHAELAAGAASLIKTVCALQAGTVPPQAHFEHLNPALDLQGAQIPTRAVPWPTDARLAAISAFGLSGTNAHIVMQGPPQQPAQEASGPVLPVQLLPISASSDRSLRQLAAGLMDRGPLADVAASLLRRRSLPVRAAVVAANPAEAAVALARVMERGGHIASRSPRVALLFSGQGSQYAGMAQGLRVLPVIEQTLQEAAAVLDPLLGRPLASLLDDGEALTDTRFTQPALLAVEVAIARQWLAWGVEPVAMVGHSLGELAAAVLAGVFDFTQGLQLAAVRGRLMSEQPGGQMVAVMAPVAQVNDWLVDGVEVAAVNHAEETVVGGGAEAMARFLSGLSGVETRPLKVSHAFHTASLDGMLDTWEQRVEEARPQVPQRRLVSLLTGAQEREAYADPRFWRRHAREAVQVAPGLEALGQLGVDLLIDVGPHPTLLGLAAHVLEQPGIASQRRGEDALRALLDAAGAAFVAGIDLQGIAPGGRPAVLPDYPFDDRRFWLEEPSAPTDDWTYGLVWEALAAREDSLPRTVLTLGGDPLGLTAALRLHGVEVDAMEADADADADWLIDFRPLADTDPKAVMMGVVQGVLRPGRARRVVLTRGGAEEEPEALAWAVGGMMRSLQLEAREVHPTWIDVAHGATADDVMRALRAGSEDNLSAGADVRVARLARRRVRGQPPKVSGTWWVTGGLGTLGLRVARWLVERGASTLVLTGRTALPERESWEAVGDARAAKRIEAVRGLEALGAAVIPVAVDVTDEEAMAALYASHPPDGVVHVAGVTLPQAAREIDERTFRLTLAAKVEGARVLDRLTHGQELQGFVMFGSIAAAWGSVELAAYAGANGYLDGIAAQRRARGDTALSVSWGPWGGGGMVDAERAARLERAGQHLLPPDQALSVLGSLMSGPHAHAVVARVDWPRFLAAVEAAGPRPLLSTFRPLVAEAAPLFVPGPTPAPVVRSWTQRGLTEQVRARAREVLRLADERPLADDTPLMELGFDSLMATELKRVLLADGIDVPLGRLLGGPSVEELVMMAEARARAEEPAPVVLDEGDGAPAGAGDSLPAHLIWSHVAALIVGIGAASAVWWLL